MANLTIRKASAADTLALPSLLEFHSPSLALTHTHKVHHCRPSADVLYTSVSAAYGARAVGVVLTGGDGDGAAGVQAIKASGGVTMAQDQSSSQQPSMPRNDSACIRVRSPSTRTAACRLLHCRCSTTA